MTQEEQERFIELERKLQIYESALESELIRPNGYLVIAKEISQTPLTQERLDLTYREGGPALAPFRRVYSVGCTPMEAIGRLGFEVGWGHLDDFEEQERDSPSGWYYRFTADGTSMKASGWYVPGGVILDWWK